jgi:hypothetical protein
MKSRRVRFLYQATNSDPHLLCYRDGVADEHSSGDARQHIKNDRFAGVVGEQLAWHFREVLWDDRRITASKGVFIIGDDRQY